MPRIFRMLLNCVDPFSKKSPVPPNLDLLIKARALLEDWIGRHSRKVKRGKKWEEVWFRRRARREALFCNARVSVWPLPSWHRAASAQMYSIGRYTRESRFQPRPINRVDPTQRESLHLLCTHLGWAYLVGFCAPCVYSLPGFRFSRGALALYRYQRGRPAFRGETKSWALLSKENWHRESNVLA